jgi:alkylhydroperoxidase/carboxymuconolactone decarboxylase family protein YurZ
MSAELIEVEGQEGTRVVIALGDRGQTAPWPELGPLTELYQVHQVAQEEAAEPGAEEYGASALGLVTAAVGERVHLAGRGEGAAAALALAANQPRRTGRVALIGPALAADGVDLADITAPVLVIVGPDDADQAKGLAAAIANARLEVLPNGPRPGPVSALLLAHFGAAATVASGYASRRVALGDEHVDRTVASISEFAAPFQDFLTRYCWGEVWTRPGLSRRDRSLATIAGLIVLGAEHEIILHTRAGLRHGLTMTEIRELLQHMALYAGLPRAFSALQAIDKKIAAGELPAPE